MISYKMWAIQFHPLIPAVCPTTAENTFSEVSTSTSVLKLVLKIQLYLLFALKLPSSSVYLWQGLGVICGCAHLLKMHTTYEESMSFHIPDFECETKAKKRMQCKNFRRKGWSLAPEFILLQTKCWAEQLPVKKTNKSGFTYLWTRIFTSLFCDFRTVIFNNRTEDLSRLVCSITYFTGWTKQWKYQAYNRTVIVGLFIKTLFLHCLVWLQWECSYSRW